MLGKQDYCVYIESQANCSQETLFIVIFFLSGIIFDSVWDIFVFIVVYKKIVMMQAEVGDISDLKMAHLVAVRNKCRRHTLANVR